jgi:hypothetical protein
MSFPGLARVMLLNARAVFYADHARTTLLLTFEDVTERRAIEREKEELLRRTEELFSANTHEKHRAFYSCA